MVIVSAHSLVSEQRYVSLLKQRSDMLIVQSKKEDMQRKSDISDNYGTGSQCSYNTDKLFMLDIFCFCKCVAMPQPVMDTKSLAECSHASHFHILLLPLF